MPESLDELFDGLEIMELMRMGTGVNYISYYHEKELRLHLPALSFLIEKKLANDLGVMGKNHRYQLTNKGVQTFDTLMDTYKNILG